VHAVHVVHRSLGESGAELRGAEPVEVVSSQLVKALRPECGANLLIDLASVLVQRFRRPTYPLPVRGSLVEQRAECRRAPGVPAPLHFCHQSSELLCGFAPAGSGLSSGRGVHPADLLRLTYR
jgi:hypothetical protein